MEVNLAGGVGINAQTVMTGRGCAIGQSGSGKSFLAGVVAEELCKASMPFCIIDTEGEYSSLRSISRNVIVVGGDHGDISLDVDFGKLFGASIASEIQVVLDLSDEIDKNSVAQKALTALYDLESRMRKPYLVIIEEADKFAPQVTRTKVANMVEEISVRGRKRGIGLFITTQRPANISKNVLAQCSYGFVGRLTIENDINALRILFSSSDKLASITRLTTGEFIPFGLDFSDRFRVKPREAEHTGSTPQVGIHRPSSGRIASVIKELSGGREAASMMATARHSQRQAAGQAISSLPLSVSIDDATSMARDMARRRFLIAGEAVEMVDGVELKYMPLASLTLRFPTGRRNEYLEYSCMVDGSNRMVRLGKCIDVLRIDAGSSHDGNPAYKRYLMKEPAGAVKVQADKEDLLIPVNERKIKGFISRIFPDAVIARFDVVHAPVYRITLRRGNRVRVFGIDGVYGKKVDV